MLNRLRWFVYWLFHRPTTADRDAFSFYRDPDKD
jgi:hypothetical protein